MLRLRQLRLITHVFIALRALLLFTWTLAGLIHPSAAIPHQSEAWRMIHTVQVSPQNSTVEL